MINYCEDGERIDTLTEKLKIIQSKNVFSFSMDAVLLAHFAYIPKNGIIVDLCSGNGVIPLLLSDKTNSKIYGVEIQEKLVDMAHRSVELNDLQTQIRIVHEDLINSPQILGKGTVDLVTVNPPYLEQNGQEKNSNQYIATARHEIMTDLSQVITTSSQLLKIGGRLSMIHRPSRLVDIIFLLRQVKLEPKKIRFVHPNKNKEANMVLIEAYKNGGKEVTLMSPLIIYDENGKYSEEVNNIYFGEKNE